MNSYLWWYMRAQSVQFGVSGYLAKRFGTLAITFVIEAKADKDRISQSADWRLGG